jgi:class 3 adenylate cyclase
VLFADLAGFAAMSERMDPEDVKAMADRCAKRMGDEIHRFGGTVVDVMGDAVMAFSARRSRTKTIPSGPSGRDSPFATVTSPTTADRFASTLASTLARRWLAGSAPRGAISTRHSATRSIPPPA